MVHWTGSLGNTLSIHIATWVQQNTTQIHITIGKSTKHKSAHDKKELKRAKTVLIRLVKPRRHEGDILRAKPGWVSASEVVQKAGMGPRSDRGKIALAWKVGRSFPRGNSSARRARVAAGADGVEKRGCATPQVKRTVKWRGTMVPRGTMPLRRSGRGHRADGGC